MSAFSILDTERLIDAVRIRVEAFNAARINALTVAGDVPELLASLESAIREVQQLQAENREMRADLTKRDSIDAGVDVTAFAVLNDSLAERDTQLAAMEAERDSARAATDAAIRGQELLKAGHCTGTIRDGFVVCGEGGNFCSAACQWKAERDEWKRQYSMEYARRLDSDKAAAWERELREETQRALGGEASAALTAENAALRADLEQSRARHKMCQESLAAVSAERDKLHAERGSLQALLEETPDALRVMLARASRDYARKESEELRSLLSSAIVIARSLMEHFDVEADERLSAIGEQGGIFRTTKGGDSGE